MRSRCWGIFLVIAFVSSSGPCLAEEIAGKLERVDKKTVTLRGSNDKKLVLNVDNGNRVKAAPYIGKWVTVKFRTENGTRRAVVFSPCR